MATAAPDHRRADGDAPPLQARVVLRPLASPLPVGLCGLAIASLLVTSLDLGWIAAVEAKQVGFLLLATAVPLQAVAAVFCFPGRDAAAATAVGVLSVAWAADGLTRLTSRPGSTSAALGIVLLMGAALLLASASTQATGKVLAAVAIGGAAVRFAVSGIYEITGSGGWQDASGAVGIGVAAIALYAVWALQLEDEQESTILPTLRRGAGRAALSGDAADQLDGVVNEAGVRRQL